MPATEERPDFLILGHVTKDILEEGYVIGGTATYAGIVGIKLGVRTAVVTSCDNDIDVNGALSGAEVKVIPSQYSTTFENIYVGNKRQQRLLARALPISIDDVPSNWRRAPVILLGPVARELESDLFDAFPHALVGITPQGMMRGWGEDHKVFPIHWKEADKLLKHVQVAILSEDDLVDESDLDMYLNTVPTVVVTRSDRGATVFHQGQERSFPAFRCNVVDATGAGDVFAASFLIELYRTGSLEHAATFANAAASFAIEAVGPTGIPTREKIEKRIAEACYILTE